MSYQALKLNGNGYASIAHASQAGLNMGLSDFMIEIRVKLNTPLANQSDFPRIIEKMVASATGYRAFFDSGGTISLRVGDGTAKYANADGSFMDDLAWHTLAFIVDRSSATGLKIYNNGTELSYTIQRGVNAITGSFDTSHDFEVGVDTSYMGTSLCDASFDNLLIWNFGFGGLPTQVDYEAYITWRAQGRNVFKDISEYNSGSWNGYTDADRTNEVTDPGIESWVGDTPDNYSQTNESAGVRDITEEPTEIHGGAAAAKLQATNNNGTFFGLAQVITLSVNKYYELLGWLHYPTRTAGDCRLRLYNPTDVYWVSVTLNSTNAAYAQISVVGKPTVDSNTIMARMYSETTTGIVYIDDVSVKRTGLVSRYKFNGDYTDETSNGNDLAAGGTGNIFLGYSLKRNKIISPYSIR